MKNDTPLNILVSYAYLYGQKDFMAKLEKKVLDGKVNLMFDSGAYTKFNAKCKMDHVNLKDYVAWLKEYSWMCEKYVMLDVVGNAKESRRNYEYMLDQGLNPMFVVTAYEKDFDYVRKAVNQNPNVCVAGGATSKNDWIIKRFQDVYRETDGKAKIHGLGYYTFPKMFQLNLASIDSSTWCTAPARYGSFIMFSAANQKISRKYWRYIVSGRRKFSDEEKALLHKHKITPQMFCDRTNHFGYNNMEKFLSIMTNLELQKYSKKRGLDFFMAVGMIEDLDSILTCDENPNISYLDFRRIWKPWL